MDDKTCLIRRVRQFSPLVGPSHFASSKNKVGGLSCKLYKIEDASDDDLRIWSKYTLKGFVALFPLNKLNAQARGISSM